MKGVNKVPTEEKAWQKTNILRSETEQRAFYLIMGKNILKLLQLVCTTNPHCILL